MTNLRYSKIFERIVVDDSVVETPVVGFVPVVVELVVGLEVTVTVTVVGPDVEVVGPVVEVVPVVDVTVIVVVVPVVEVPVVEVSVIQEVVLKWHILCRKQSFVAVFGSKNVILSRFWVKTSHFRSFWGLTIDFGPL